MAGNEDLAVWREAGEWWLNEPYREYRRYIDGKGIRREQAQLLSNNAFEFDSGQKPVDREHREEWVLRERKIRDEKCAAANGAFSPAYYEQASKERHGAPWESNAPRAIRKARQSYAPLHVLSGYAFGRGLMIASEIASFAAIAECPAAAIADPYSLVGAVEHDKSCRQNGIKPLIGASIELPEGGFVVLIAQNRKGYQNLSQLITECHLGEGRCYPLGSWERLERFAEGLLCLTGGDVGPIDRHLVRREYEKAKTILERLVGVFNRDNVFAEIDRGFLPWSLAVERQLLRLADDLNVKPVAGGLVSHGRREHFVAQDVVVCAESLCLIEEITGRKPLRDESQPSAPIFPARNLNAERFIRSSQEMGELYSDRPDLLANTLCIAERCEDRVLPDRTNMPQLFDDDGRALRDIVEMGALTNYGTITRRHRKRLDLELGRITKLGYASHFLIAWDVCRWAREQSIQMSGRGSVVDSAVAYTLGLSRIDAIRHDLHFDRFLPADNTKRPDIDIDFEAHRRDDVRGYMVSRYGIERTAAVCAIGTYCTRGIVREVGKVMGLPNETISFLAKKIHGGIPPSQIEAALNERPELRDSNIPREKFTWVFKLAERLMDVPRNIRTHSSGVVISDRPISETVPVMWSASPSSKESAEPDQQLRMIQWDKRSAKYFFDKFDILCLRGQDVLSGVERRVRSSTPDFSVERIEATTDPEVYRAMKSGELIGIPQSASPAMRQAHVRLRTNDLHDASLVQAGIRPGVGGAVKLNELIARRRGKPFTYEHPDMEKILGHTYGIIVFQEQVDQILQTFCDYSGGEAEDIRDLVHKRRREDMRDSLREAVIDRVIAKGYSFAVAQQVLELVCGFKGYGFAQGHALAFAEVSLRSVWCMQNNPAEYFASLLSAQPAGYYGPCTIANEARTRGVKMLSVDVNRSGKLFEVEDAFVDHLKVPGGAIRVGLMQVANVSATVKERIVEWQSAVGKPQPAELKQPLKSSPRSAVALAERDEPQPPDVHAFGSFFDFVRKVQPSRDELEVLIFCGALDALCPNRRAMLWAIPEAQHHAGLQREFDKSNRLPFELDEPRLNLDIEDFCEEEKRIQERQHLGLDVDVHLLAYERAHIIAHGGVTGTETKQLKPGSRAVVVGNPLRLRFPPTSSGKRVVFFDLEDETGLLNVTCFDEQYRRDGKAIVCAPYVTVIGEVQDRDGYPAFLVHRVFEYKPRLLNRVGLSAPIRTADFLVG